MGNGDCGHIDDAPHCGAGGEYVYGFGCTEQDGADGDVVARGGFQQGVGNVGCIQIGHDEQVGAALQGVVGHEGLAQCGVECQVAMHFAFYFEPGGSLVQYGQGAAHFVGGGVVG